MTKKLSEKHPRLLGEKGKRFPLLGNEAIARGAIEAGVGLVASYPGTPSSEVPMTLAKLSKDVGYYFEYSTNEKVSFEVAAGAAWSGVRSLVAMKHFGLNVASDSFSPVAYVGIEGGMVMVVADDPQGWSSAQSEQDTRYFGRMMRIPILEPSDPQEALELTKKAFEISEEFKIPFILRTTTKVSHAIETVKLGEIKKAKTKGRFKKNPEQYNNVRPHLQQLHREIDQKLVKINKKYGKKLNKVVPGKGKTGIITTGVSHEYVKEALQKLDLKVPIAKLTLTYPTPKEFISKFIKNKETVLVVEELQPVIENEVNRIAKDINPQIKVHGKNMLPRDGEYNMEIILPVMEKIFKKKLGVNFKKHQKKAEKAMKGIPPRKPVFCAGCPHRSTFYALKEVYGNDEVIYAGDVGCYVLGMFEPYKMQDFMISMGASTGLGHGINKATDQEVVVTIGDSTFFHSAMPGIANYSFNDGEAPLIVVFDNGVTAMTGHQPHPGTGLTGMGEKINPLKIEEVAEALGAEVVIANAYNQKELTKKIKELRNKKTERGPKVLVSKGECRLVTKRKYRRKGVPLIKFQINQDKCKKCGVCTNEFACPAIKEERKKTGDEPKYTIDTQLCLGCSVCSQVCPHNAIKAEKGGKK